MTKRYKKRGNYETINDYIKHKIGTNIRDLNKYKSYQMAEIPKIANRIQNAISHNKKIIVYGDFDVDGISSVCQFILLLKSMHATFSVSVPRRFSDGYGVKTKFTQKLDPNTVLILVDNGIAAIDAIQTAVERGAEVIVMDHHMSAIDVNHQTVLPNAHIILDPEALPIGNDYVNYCGAGLVYKLVEYMAKDNHLITKCSAFAALGTVADMVPLTEDNRRIVQNGLYAMNIGDIPYGLYELINKMEYLGRVTSETISYYLAPVINAAGRLYDEGGKWVAITLLEENHATANKMVEQLIQINATRKDIVRKLMEEITLDPNDKVYAIRTPDGAPLGCLGLVAGKITEETKKSTFVYSCDSKTGICKGSARSDDETTNHVKEMLDGIRPYLLEYGGHPGAAGFSFHINNESIIRDYLTSYPVIPHDPNSYYDLVVRPKDLMQTLDTMDLCEPFGKGMEKPVFCMPCHFTQDGYWKAVGSNSEHLSFILPGTDYKAIAFNFAEQYSNQGRPKRINLYGQVAWNWYQGNRYPQFMVDDYEIC